MVVSTAGGEICARLETVLRIVRLVAERTYDRRRARGAAAGLARAGDEIGAQNFGPFAQEALARYAPFPATTIPCISTRKQQRRQVSPGACAWHADALLFRTVDHGVAADLFIARLSAKFLRPCWQAMAFA